MMALRTISALVVLALSAATPALAQSLHLAAQLCDMDAVNRLLADGARINDRNATGNTPLHYVMYAVSDTRRTKNREQCAPVVRRLLAARAIPNVWNEDGATPLHLAAWNCRADRANVVQALLDGDAWVDAKHKKSGDSPLHVAVTGENPNCAQLLVDAGAKVNARNREGDTPLHLAALHNRSAGAVVLLAAGASREIRNQAGETALDVARMWEHKLVATIIEKNIKTAAGMLAAIGFSQADIEDILRREGAR